MHYAHLHLQSRLVTIDTTPYVLHSILIGKAVDRTFLINKIELIANPDNTIDITSLDELYPKLLEVGLVPDPKDMWRALVSQRSDIINAICCGCDNCYNTLKDVLS